MHLRHRPGASEPRAEVRAAGIEGLETETLALGRPPPLDRAGAVRIAHAQIDVPKGDRLRGPIEMLAQPRAPRRLPHERPRGAEQNRIRPRRHEDRVQRRPVPNTAHRLRRGHRQPPHVAQVPPIARLLDDPRERVRTDAGQVLEAVPKPMRPEGAIDLESAGPAIRQRIPEAEETAVRDPDRRVRPPKEARPPFQLPGGLDRQRDLVDEIAVRPETAPLRQRLVVGIDRGVHLIAGIEPIRLRSPPGLQAIGRLPAVLGRELRVPLGPQPAGMHRLTRPPMSRHRDYSATAASPTGSGDAPAGCPASSSS